MGQVVPFPNCPVISPEVFRLIKQRTKNATYWLRYWSAYRSAVYEFNDAIDPDDDVLYYTELHLMIYLHDRNRAAIKARGF